MSPTVPVNSDPSQTNAGKTLKLINRSDSAADMLNIEHFLRSPILKKTISSPLSSFCWSIPHHKLRSLYRGVQDSPMIGTNLQNDPQGEQYSVVATNEGQIKAVALHNDLTLALNPNGDCVFGVEQCFFLTRPICPEGNDTQKNEASLSPYETESDAEESKEMKVQLDSVRLKILDQYCKPNGNTLDISVLMRLRAIEEYSTDVSSMCNHSLHIFFIIYIN